MSKIQDIPPGTVKCAEGLGDISPSRASAIRDAAYAMADAFPWRLSPEGFAFWGSISKRLFDLAHEAEAAAPRPKVPEPVVVKTALNDLIEVRAQEFSHGGRVLLNGDRADGHSLTTAQAREAAAALTRMADALDAQS